MPDCQSRFPVRILTAALAVMTFAACEDPAPEPATDYSKEGPDALNAQTEFTETPSGLKYRILREGTGKKPTPADHVLASYRGWLDDGTEFDSSYKQGEPVPFGLDQVIDGWTEGLQLIGEGGKIELTIPPELGYGERGYPPVIPPNARLHFIVELHDVSD